VDEWVEGLRPRGDGLAIPMTDILVVDDDRGIRETLGDVLSDEGYRVRLARDGGEALTLLRQGRPPDLILLDLSMPGMSGAEFLKAQLGDPKLAAIPVVVLSADQRSHCPGVAGFLRKPVDLDQLLAAVGQFKPRSCRSGRERDARKYRKRARA
jgi:CheY-like chemotaxis protein